MTPDGKRAVSGSRRQDAEGLGPRLPGSCSAPSKDMPLGQRRGDDADGKRAVSASDDKTLKVWDLATGTLRTLKGHADSVNAVAMTPDGKRAVSGSDDKTLKVWDLATGRRSARPQGHADVVNAVAMTPDGKRAVSASSDRTLKVWDLASGTCSAPSKGMPVGLCRGGDARRHAGRLRVQTTNPEGVGPRLRHAPPRLEARRPVNAVAMTPDGKRAVSASDDTTLKVWDLATGTLLPTLKGTPTRSEPWR